MMVEINNLPSKSLRASGTLREKPRWRKNIYETKCVICHKFTKNKIYGKHRLEDDREAKKFLKMAKNWLDDVFGRCIQ